MNSLCILVLLARAFETSHTDNFTMALNEKTAVDISEHQEAVDEAVHVPKDLASEAAAAGQGLTGYEGLSVWGTIKAFKMNALICSLIAVSAATDGYQIGFV